MKTNITNLSNDKRITRSFGRSLLLPFFLKKYFHSSAMQRFFEKNWKQNKFIQLDGFIISSLLSLLFLVFTFPFIGNAQDNLPYDLKYEINRVYPSLSITKDKLTKAQTLKELNQYYKSSWVKYYNSVEITTINKGILHTAVSKNDQLTEEQKERMATADIRTDIAIKVKYLPENTLVHNEPKEMNFSFTVDPEKEAMYAGGPEQLDQYLQDKGVDKIYNVEQYNLAAVKFVVNEEGKVIDAQVVESSKDEKTDQLLLETTCNMPDWSPAAYANGTKVKQEFVLTVGDHTSCIVNLLNIRRLEAEGK